ncbi:MAG: 2-oxo acid dehydrogenase subunit E2, partial [Mesorhizobium sp.]|nr:2-oxo acid dehydrogenase subunit E2 [Mesorhizobium sp.]
TYLPFIARATCIALRDFPQVNARLDGGALVLSREVNLGIAVDLSHNGLVVPVVRNADDLTLPGLARAIGRQVEKARAGRLTADDFSGGTYSISNNGAFGTAFTAPIINAPQVAILSTDAIRLRATVVETPEGAFVAPRLTGTVGQSFDHRAFDGAYSAAFLSRLKAVLQERDWDAEFA